jgi:hypothetical protein
LIGRHLLAQGGKASGAFVAGACATGACATGARQLLHQIGAGGSEATPLLGREGLPAMPVGVIRIWEPSAASSNRASGLASQSAVNCSGVRRRPTQSEADRLSDFSCPASHSWPNRLSRALGVASMGLAVMQDFRLKVTSDLQTSAGRGSHRSPVTWPWVAATMAP